MTTPNADSVRVVRKKGIYSPGPDAYAVVLGSVLIGMVRKTDSWTAKPEWTGKVWVKESYGARSLEPLEGNFRFRSTAVDAVVVAWNDDNEPTQVDSSGVQS